jgi:hypothetical protein
MTVRPVGRPPETGADGEIVAKSLVNVTIPTKLAQYLKDMKINRSKLFTRIVTMLYVNSICRYCYSLNMTETLTGSRCDDCEKWVAFKKCGNCGTDYDMRPYVKRSNIDLLPVQNAHHNCFTQSDKIEMGCWACIKKEDRR